MSLNSMGFWPEIPNHLKRNSKNSSIEVHLWNTRTQLMTKVISVNILLKVIKIERVIWWQVVHFRQKWLTVAQSLWIKWKNYLHLKKTTNKMTKWITWWKVQSLTWVLTRPLSIRKEHWPISQKDRKLIMSALKIRHKIKLLLLNLQKSQCLS